jgi:hypothetical protein
MTTAQDGGKVVVVIKTTKYEVLKKFMNCNIVRAQKLKPCL